MANYTQVAGASLGAHQTIPAGSPTTWAAGSLGAAVQVGDLVVVSIDTNNTTGSGSAVSSLSDGLGNTYGKATPAVGPATSFGYDEETSIWVAKVTSAGTPSFTVTFAAGQVAGGGNGLAAQAYRPNSGFAFDGTTDISKSASNASVTTADSGTTATTTANANELKVGGYGDGGYTTTLSAGTLDTTYAMAAKSDVQGNAQVAVEDADSGASGSTARAEITSNGNVSDHMFVVVFVLTASATIIVVPKRRNIVQQAVNRGASFFRRISPRYAWLA